PEIAMRIALFSDVYKPVINGVVNHVSLLKKYFEQWGEQVWLFVPGQNPTEEDEPNVIRLPGIPIADTGYHLSVTIDQRARNILKMVDIIHVHHPFISGAFGLTLSRRYNIPLVFTNHTRYDLYVREYLPLVPDAVSETALQAYFSIFSQRCAALIAPSPSIAEVMRGWGVQGKIVVIPNGVELERYRKVHGGPTRAELGIPEDAVVGLYLGRISGEKSIDRLIRIYAILIHEEPRIHLLLVGGGPDLEDCRELAHELGLDGRVTFTGAVPYEQTPGYLKLGDYFVSASVTEVHPLTFIEAAAAGLPLVGIDSPGVSDIIRHGETGLIAQDNDLSLGLCILHMVRDPELRARLAAAAQADSNRFAAHTTAREVLRLYESLTR
ncbi:MAG: glycosyltransferase family 4 protein, partial [Caldilineae bacterium]